jgi:hypothetical protein
MQAVSQPAREPPGAIPMIVVAVGLVE